MKLKLYFISLLSILFLFGCSEVESDSVNNTKTINQNGFEYNINEDGDKELIGIKNEGFNKYLLSNKDKFESNFKTIENFNEDIKIDFYYNENFQFLYFDLNNHSLKEFIEPIILSETLFMSERYKSVSSGKTVHNVYIGKDVYDVYVKTSEGYYKIKGEYLVHNFSYDFFNKLIEPIKESELTKLINESASIRESLIELDKLIEQNIN